MISIERSIRAQIPAGSTLLTPTRSKPFQVESLDDRGIVLLLGEDRATSRLSWAALEGIRPLLASGHWLRIGGSFSVDGEPGSLDGYLKGHIKRATAGWVASLLEAAGVVEIDRTRPARIRLASELRESAARRDTGRPEAVAPAQHVANVAPDDLSRRSPRLRGHLFVTHGSVTQLACDAFLVPSGLAGGRRGHLVAPWSDLDLPLDSMGHVLQIQETTDRVAVVVQGTAETPSTWVGHTGESDMPASWYVEAVLDFVDAAASDQHRLVKRPLSDDRPLLAVPLVGTGHGGYAHDKGDLLKTLIQRLLDVLERVEADVVLVLNKAQNYAAAQQARLRYGADRLWCALSPTQADIVRELANKAASDQLVLFMGAGTGIGAGLPTWDDLLDHLARKAGLTPEERGELSKLDPRDSAEVLVRRFGKPELLRREITAELEGDRVSVLHQLLASLPVHEALTTNYDDRFERSWRAAGRDPAVLPEQGTAEGPDWLLKLHGSVTAPTSDQMVLSRADYLRFEGDGVALAGLVHAMLLTRHILFVGYSLRDDNFHRIVHQVRSAVRGSSVKDRGLGTVLTPDEHQIIDEIWDPVLGVCSTAGAGENPVRRMAILLDRLGAEAATVGHLLDRSFASVLTEPETALRDALVRVQELAYEPGVRDVIRQTVDTMLLRFGAEPGHHRSHRRLS